MFQHELHQSTKMYDNNRNGSRIGHDGSGDRKNSFNYNNIDASV